MRKIFCVPTRWVGGYVNMDTLNFAPDRINSVRRLLEQGEMRPMGEHKELEDDENWKQIIPYIVFRCGPFFLQYNRGSTAGEQRLKEFTSIGIGGHMESPHLITNMLREVEEEVSISGLWSPTFRYCGLVYDPTTPVGRVHLGLVFVVEAPHPDRFRFEARKETNKLRFNLLGEIEKYEQWSQAIINNLKGL